MTRKQYRKPVTPKSFIEIVCLNDTAKSLHLDKDGWKYQNGLRCLKKLNQTVYNPIPRPPL